MFKKSITASILAIALSSYAIADTSINVSVKGQGVTIGNSPLVFPDYTENTKSVITDIVVFYTEQAVNKVGGVDALYDYIDRSVAESNDYMTRNKVSIERRVSAIIPFDGSIQEPASSLGGLIGYVKENRSDLESRYGSTYYVLIVGELTENRAGFATLGGYVSYITPFSGGGLEYDTMAHEIGHNDGLKHELVGNEDFDTAAGSKCGDESSLMSSDSSNRRSNFLSSPEVFNSEAGVYCGDVSLGQDVRGFYFDAVENDKIVNRSITFNNYIEPIKKSGEVTLSVVTDVYDEAGGTVTLMIDWSGVEYDLGSVEVYAKSITTDDGDFAFENTRIDITQGSGSETLVVALIDDSDVESTESFEVGLRYPVAVNINSEPVEINVQSEDSHPKGDIQISGSVSITEGESADMILTRVGGSRGQITVDIVPQNGETQGSDYSLSETQVVFEDGEISKSVSIAAVDDTIVESDESLMISLSTNDQESQVSGSVSVVVVDNDNVPTTPTNPTNPNPSSGGASGGSMGLSAFLIGLIAIFRRLKEK